MPRSAVWGAHTLEQVWRPSDPGCRGLRMFQTAEREPLVHHAGGVAGTVRKGWEGREPGREPGRMLRARAWPSHGKRGREFSAAAKLGDPSPETLSEMG